MANAFSVDVLPGFGAGGDQAAAQIVDVFGHLRVVEKRSLVLADVAHEFDADLALDLRRQQALRGFAQFGQTLGDTA
jgi:hypothetical protein